MVGLWREGWRAGRILTFSYIRYGKVRIMLYLVGENLDKADLHEANLYEANLSETVLLENEEGEDHA